MSPRPRTHRRGAVVTNERLTHGLRAAAIVLPSESDDEWRKFHDDVTAQFAPEGPVEASLASRVAELLWRIRRVALAERQFVALRHMHNELIDTERAERAGELASPAAPPEDGAVGDLLSGNGHGSGSFYGSALHVVGGLDAYKRSLPAFIPDDAGLEKIIRYEAHLTRQLNYALHELEALQDRRNGNVVPLARVDVTGLPGT